MARYRRMGPVVEAWQVGTGTMPDWVRVFRDAGPGHYQERVYLDETNAENSGLAWIKILHGGCWVKAYGLDWLIRDASGEIRAVCEAEFRESFVAA